MRLVVLVVVLLGSCRSPRGVPPAPSPDQSVRDAVVLVCDAPRRAEPDVARGVGRSDAIAGHLTDGVGHERVLPVVEGWKTDGIDLAVLDALLADAGITACALRAVTAR